MQFFSSSVCRLTVTSRDATAQIVGLFVSSARSWYVLAALRDHISHFSERAELRLSKQRLHTAASQLSTHNYTLELGQWENNFLIILQDSQTVETVCVCLDFIIGLVGLVRKLWGKYTWMKMWHSRCGQLNFCLKQMCFDEAGVARM